MRNLLFIISAFIAIICLAGANIGGIGYFLYLWGASSVPIGAAAWAAFVLWLKLAGVGIVSGITALVLKD